jgi:acetyl-CoA acyltransferase 2
VLNCDGTFFFTILFQLSSSDGNFLPRHVSLQCGIPIDRPALGLNRLCGSGFQAVINGAQDILVGAAKVSLTGGVDNMSQTPYCVRNIRFGTALGTNPILEDALWVRPKFLNIPCV